MSRERILVADDDADVRSVVEAVLSSAGFDALGAADGSEGIERASKSNRGDHPGEEFSMTEHEDDAPELPEGFEKVEATVCRKGEELIVFGDLEEGPFVFHLRLARKEEDFGPPPPGFGWTGEERPPKKGEWFWSELRGRAIQAVKDETGVNQFGEPTGGRRILKPLGTSGRAVQPSRAGLRLVKNDDPAE